MWARPDGASRDVKGEPVALEFACQSTQVTQGTSVSSKPGGTDVYARIPGSRPLGNPFSIKLMKRLEDLHLSSTALPSPLLCWGRENTEEGCWNAFVLAT